MPMIEYKKWSLLYGTIFCKQILESSVKYSIFMHFAFFLKLIKDKEELLWIFTMIS